VLNAVRRVLNAAFGACMGLLFEGPSGHDLGSRPLSIATAVPTALQKAKWLISLGKFVPRWSAQALWVIV
jgi:hypothetical protein